MADILAVIPFYKRPEQLAKCLSNLRASSRDIEAFVVDNNQYNRGFTKACNMGLREAVKRGHKYALLLNQDCYVQPDAIGNVIAFMDAHPRCAIAGSKQLSAEDQDLVVHGGCTDAFPVGLHITGKVSANDCAVSLPMPWINGACMIVRIEAIQEVGLMDEGFFLICSDADLCFLARQRGWEVWYCAESVVLHEGGGVSSQQTTLEALAHFNADQLHFRNKWLGSISWECLKKAPPVPGSRVEANDLRAALENALQFFHKNELRQAEILVRRILDFESENESALLVLARIHIEVGAPAFAARTLQSFIDRVPGSAQTHLALADALFLSNFTNESMHHYRQARLLGLNSVGLCNNLGLALLRDGKKADAIAEWQAALKMDPANPNALEHLNSVGAL
jgi:GT2 family glycosyltransferase